LIENTTGESESLKKGATKSQESIEIKSSQRNMENNGQALGANNRSELGKENWKKSRF
jgi:hypothetical protein